MQTNHRPKSATTGHNLDGRQDGDKTASRIRARSGEGTAAYWRAKLFRNSYRDRDGRTVEIPEYYVRMRHDGSTKRVRLHTSDKDKAADEALVLSGRLAREGWSAVTSGLARLPASPSIDEFCEAFKTAAASFERPIRPVTVKLYLRHLRQICVLAGVTRMRDLSPDAVQRARETYKAKAIADKREASATTNSLAIITGNAKACFQPEARAILARQGLVIDSNPFQDVKRTTHIKPVTALPRETIAKIWADLPLLRDGDTSAEAPNVERFRASYKRKHEGRRARWIPTDYRQPQPAAYLAILLGLGLGLRANEIDKARWSWLLFDGKGDCFLRIGEEEDFKPKGGTMRLLRVPAELHAALVKTRIDATSPYILGGQMRGLVNEDGTPNENSDYRCRDAIRTANEWLAARGIEAGKQHGRKLHALRKQFGSEVATTFGLFAAQKLLGHASPMVTSQFYAGQTDLPNLTHVRIAG